MPGRGGAGNYEAAQANAITSRMHSQSRKSSLVDLEAQNQPTQSSPPVASSSSAPALSVRTSTAVRTRSPRPPSIRSQSSSKSRKSTKPPPQTPQYACKGRGGAGNLYQPSELEQTGSFVDTILSPTLDSIFGKGTGESFFGPPTSPPVANNADAFGSDSLRSPTSPLSPGRENKFDNVTSPTNPFSSYFSGTEEHTPRYSEDKPAGNWEVPKAKMGRGGMGNMIWEDTKEREAERERQRMEREKKEEEVRRKVREEVDGAMGGVEGGLRRPEGAFLGVGQAYEGKGKGIARDRADLRPGDTLLGV